MGGRPASEVAPTARLFYSHAPARPQHPLFTFHVSSCRASLSPSASLANPPLLRHNTSPHERHPPRKTPALRQVRPPRTLRARPRRGTRPCPPRRHLRLRHLRLPR